MSMMIMMTMNSLSFMFSMTNHPMSMGIILMIQTILISLMSGIMNKTFWFSYMIFLIMIGGLLILFIYMTSIASNEKFKFSMKMFITLMLINLSFIMILKTDLNLSLLNSNNLEIFNSINMITNENSKSLNKMFNLNNYLIMIMMILYLLITLIASVKITFFKSGPLRQKF